MSNKFRKKPVVIEALRFMGPFSYDEMVDEWGASFAAVAKYQPKMNELEIKTLESHKAPLTAITGDWILRGIKGEFYPCREDIFAETYEPEP